MLLIAILAVGVPAAAVGFDHAAWGRVLNRHVNQLGETDYAALKKDRADLDAYLSQLASVSPDSHKAPFPTRQDELAYWLNAYNALVTQGVVDAWPTRSVRDVGFALAFFRRPGYTLGGRKLSLHDLENGIIRERYRDPRIHFAIVCASVGCPRLDRTAFGGSALDQHLDRLARQFLSERRNLLIRGNDVTLSSIFQWYAADFGDLRAFLLRYATGSVRTDLEPLTHPRFHYFDYDWSVNEPGSRARSKSEYERELARSLR